MYYCWSVHRSLDKVQTIVGMAIPFSEYWITHLVLKYSYVGFRKQQSQRHMRTLCCACNACYVCYVVQSFRLVSAQKTTHTLLLCPRACFLCMARACPSCGYTNGTVTKVNTFAKDLMPTPQRHDNIIILPKPPVGLWGERGNLCAATDACDDK